MKKLYIISKHILYNVGGAEKSILKYASDLKYDYKFLLGFKFITKNLNKKTGYLFEFLEVKLNINKFYFFEYYINKRVIKQQISYLKDVHIITYGIYFPVIINSSKTCFNELHIRSETDLGIFINYNTGLKYFVKFFLQLIEFPFNFFYQRELSKAIHRADKVVCNSKFMKKELYRLFKKDSVVEYPCIEIDLNGFKSTKEGIVFIGDSKIKGLNLVQEIARRMPEHTFYVFGRDTYIETKVINIVYCPWQKNVLDIYKRAKLVIVPSLWKEAYGRVAKEAVLLNLPVLVSDIGGLKEAVNYDKTKLVTNYKNSDEWISRIKDII